MLTIFIALVVLTGLTIAVIYNTKYKGHPWDIYIYWDHYIAPEHDTPMTQIIKATCCRT